MEQIHETLKCKYCLKTFSSRPIILTCCFQTICFDHITELKSDETKETSFKCKLCDKEIVENIFPTNTIAEEFMKLKLNELDFGKDYTESKASCNCLKDLLEEVESTIKDPKNYIYATISKIKNRIDLKREELKLIIDNDCELMINQLNEFEKECNENLITNEVKEKLDKLNTNKEIFKIELDKWVENLNLLIIDSKRWEMIRSRSVLSFNQMENLLSDFRNDLLMNKEYKIFEHYIKPTLKLTENVLNKYFIFNDNVLFLLFINVFFIL